MSNVEKVVAIDFDGTIVEQGSKAAGKIPNRIGRLKPHAADVIRKLKEEGFKIVIETGRVHPYFKKHEEQRQLIENFLKRHKIPFDEVVPKHPQAFVFLDDRRVFSENWLTIYKLVHARWNKIRKENIE